METVAALQRGAFPLFTYLNGSSRNRRTTRKPLFQAFPSPFALTDTDRPCIKDGMKIDPACGSGNFLTETFLRLRELENQALADRLNGQGFIDLGSDDSLVKFSIDQMHGIEINDLAVAVAKTALWIAEQQALDDTEIIASQALPHLPLHDSGNIVQANALRHDWNELLPASECNYVMGNPPFVGRNKKTKDQITDMQMIWGNEYDGNLDYVTCWFRKAADYLIDVQDAEFAFVSTNSICQGIQVSYLFKPLKALGWNIRFAHRTFAWDAQSTDIANVHVVVIGFTKKNQGESSLYSYQDLSGTPELSHPDNINGYLVSAHDVFVEKRSQKLGPISPMLSLANFGSMPRDGGNLIIDSSEEYVQAMADPIAAKYIKPFRGARELINGGERWCLWMTDVEPVEIRKSHFLSDRVKHVKEFREHSSASSTRAMAATPWLFGQRAQPEVAYLYIPSVFSKKREYATCDWFDPEVIASNLNFTCVDPDGFAFAIIESSMFMVWQKAIGGRLKSDCRFSNTVVWNNLPLPQIPEELRQRVINAGLSVLQARANHPGQSLADLYGPDYMPVDLRKAHIALDKVVDLAFGASKPCATNEERLQILFNNYAEMTKNEK